MEWQIIWTDETGIQHFMEGIEAADAIQAADKAERNLEDMELEGKIINAQCLGVAA